MNEWTADGHHRQGHAAPGGGAEESETKPCTIHSSDLFSATRSAPFLYPTTTTQTQGHHLPWEATHQAYKPQILYVLYIITHEPWLWAGGQLPVVEVALVVALAGGGVSECSGLHISRVCCSLTPEYTHSPDTDQVTS